MTTRPDFTLENHGSVCLLRPLTAIAKTWAAEYLPDDAQTFGTAIVIEPRYVADIVAGILNDGLTVK
jgi:hypothetical protein